MMLLQNKTFTLRKEDIKKKWLLIDASDLVVGRLASQIALILRGKNKPDYTPHLDCGDNIIVINCDKAKFSGKKLKDKVYYRHTGYPGGIKSTTPEKIITGNDPTRILKLAVKRMMDGGPMSYQRMKNLYLYSGSDYKQVAQKPVIVNIAKINNKNKIKDGNYGN